MCAAKFSFFLYSHPPRKEKDKPIPSTLSDPQRSTSIPIPISLSTKQPSQPHYPSPYTDPMSKTFDRNSPTRSHPFSLKTYPMISQHLPSTLPFLSFSLSTPYPHLFFFFRNHTSTNSPPKQPTQSASFHTHETCFPGPDTHKSLLFFPIGVLSRYTHSRTKPLTPNHL